MALIDSLFGGTTLMLKPRIASIDANWSKIMCESYTDLLTEHLAAIPNTPQERLIYAWDAMANDYRQLALVLYASGERLDRVQPQLGEAARAHLKMVSLRGKEKCDSVSREPAVFATGNSCSTYLAICMALIANETQIARSLATYVWDPSNAPYVAADSVLCTDKRQALAYATKYFLLDAKDKAQAHLSRLTLLPENLVGEVLMLRGLIDAKAARILKGLTLALDWHARVTEEKKNYRVPDYFVCIPALGLGAHALRLGLVTYEQLPANDVYFPRDLITV